MTKPTNHLRLLGRLNAAQLAEAVEEWLKRHKPEMEKQLRSHGVSTDGQRIEWNLYGDAPAPVVTLRPSKKISA